MGGGRIQESPSLLVWAWGILKIIATVTTWLGNRADEPVFAANIAHGAWILEFLITLGLVRGITAQQLAVPSTAKGGG